MNTKYQAMPEAVFKEYCDFGAKLGALIDSHGEREGWSSDRFNGMAFSIATNLVLLYNGQCCDREFSQEEAELIASQVISFVISKVNHAAPTPESN